MQSSKSFLIRDLLGDLITRRQTDSGESFFYKYIRQVTLKYLAQYLRISCETVELAHLEFIAYYQAAAAWSAIAALVLKSFYRELKPILRLYESSLSLSHCPSLSHLLTHTHTHAQKLAAK